MPKDLFAFNLNLFDRLCAVVINGKWPNQLLYFETSLTGTTHVSQATSSSVSCEQLYQYEKLSKRMGKPSPDEKWYVLLFGMSQVRVK